MHDGTLHQLAGQAVTEAGGMVRARTVGVKLGWRQELRDFVRRKEDT